MISRSFYLAGPIADCSNEEISSWRQRVVDQAQAYVKMWNGLANTFETQQIEILLNIPEPFDYETTPSREIVESDKKLIRNSDAIIAFPWTVSVGTSMEMMYASMVDIPIYIVADQRWHLSPWIKYHATNFVEGYIDDSLPKDGLNPKEIELPTDMSWLNSQFESLVNEVFRHMFSNA